MTSYPVFPFLPIQQNKATLTSGNANLVIKLYAMKMKSSLQALLEEG